MRIVRLEAEMIKRLRAVSLDLEGKNLVVVGRPDAGKTTVLDLLWMAFLGKAIGPETISAGSDEARIEVVLGDADRRYTVTRKLSRDGDQAGKLKVVASDGAKYGADFLKSLISDLTFDPTEFARAEGKKQVDLLLKVVKLPGGVSIDALDRERAGLYEKRTAVNRDVDRLKAKLPAEEPAEIAAVDIIEILKGIESDLEGVRENSAKGINGARAAAKASLAEAKVVNAENKRKRDKMAGFQEELAKAQSIESSLREKIAALNEELARAEKARLHIEETIEIGNPIIAALEDIDEEGIEADLESTEKRMEEELKSVEAPMLEMRSKAVTDAEATNKKAKARKDWVDAQEDLAKVKTEADGLTTQIAQVDARKKSLLESVEWPMPGLGLRDGHVTYNDVILAQCGMSVRMQVSCAIAMALNPKLKAIRIDEGESLGEEGRQEIFGWAAERGYQVLMSVVKDGPAGDGELEIIDDTLTNAPAVEAEALVGDLHS